MQNKTFIAIGLLIGNSPAFAENCKLSDFTTQQWSFPANTQQHIIVSSFADVVNRAKQWCHANCPKNLTYDQTTASKLLDRAAKIATEHINWACNGTCTEQTLLNNYATTFSQLLIKIDKNNLFADAQFQCVETQVIDLDKCLDSLLCIGEYYRPCRDK